MKKIDWTQIIIDAAKPLMIKAMINRPLDEDSFKTWSEKHFDDALKTIEKEYEEIHKTYVGLKKLHIDLLLMKEIKYPKP